MKFEKSCCGMEQLSLFFFFFFPPVFLPFFHLTIYILSSTIAQDRKDVKEVSADWNALKDICDAVGRSNTEV